MLSCDSLLVEKEEFKKSALSLDVYTVSSQFIAQQSKHLIGQNNLSGIIRRNAILVSMFVLPVSPIAFIGPMLI